MQKLVELLNKKIKENYGIELSEIKLDKPPKKELGDFAFGCFVLSKELKKSPIDISLELKELLVGEELIKDVNSDGPYLNIKISNDIYTDKINNLYSNINDFLSFDYGKGKTLFVDYIGANVGKPLHIGHICTPLQGQTIINLNKKLGYDVISDSHIGDWGIIFGKLILAYKKWGDESRLQNNAVDYLLELYVKITEEAENDESIDEAAREEFKLLSSGDKESISYWEIFTRNSIFSMNKSLGEIGVKPDYNIGESFYEGLGLPKMEEYPDLEFDMSSIVEELIDKGIATKNEDGSVGVVFEDELKIPSCILQKRNGTHGYLASDLSAIKYRSINWDLEKILYFVDVRQQLHLKQAFTIAKMAGWYNGDLIHAHNGFISLKDGAMSTRKGRIIKLDLLLDESVERAKKIILEKRPDILDDELSSLSKTIGIGAIKYGYLKKSRETDVVFDWDEFMSFEGNSGPYIQYAYVRANKILSEYGDIDINIDSGEITSDHEVNLLSKILEFREALLKTSDLNMPHILCQYAFELTKLFNSFYNNVQILSDDTDNKIIKIKLLVLFKKVLEESFFILAIDLPEKM